MNKEYEQGIWTRNMNKEYEQGLTKNNFDLFRSRSYWETITSNKWDSWDCKDDLNSSNITILSLN